MNFILLNVLNSNLKNTNYAIGDKWLDNYTLLIQLSPTYCNDSRTPKIMDVLIDCRNGMFIYYKIIRNIDNMYRIFGDYYGAWDSLPSMTPSIIFSNDRNLYCLQCIFSSKFLNVHGITSTISSIY